MDAYKVKVVFLDFLKGRKVGVFIDILPGLIGCQDFFDVIIR